MQMIDFALMTATIVVLFHYLNKQKESSDDREAFGKESRQLRIILIIFDATYVMRAIYDFCYKDFSDVASEACVGCVTMIVFYIFDALPVCCILYYHARNFKVIKFVNLTTAADSHPIS